MFSLEAVKEKYSLLEKKNDQLMQDLDSLSEEDLLFRPVPQSWNILEVLDHVKTTEAGTLIYIKKKLKYGGLKKLHWTAGLRAALMTSINNSSIRFKMPKVIQPPKASDGLEAVKEEWKSLREKWRESLNEFPKEHLDKAIFKHPLFGRLSLLQAMDSMISHQNHHIRQINRIRNKINRKH